MRALRNLSITWKLALSSLATALLLAAITWSVLAGLATQSALDAHAGAALQARRATLLAMVAMERMRQPAATLPYLQTADAVRAAAAQAEAAHGDVAARLRDMLRVIGDDATTRRGRQMIHAIGLYDLAVARLAALRLEVIRQRDEAFLPSQQVFEDAVRALHEAVGPETSISQAATDTVRQQVASYHDAVVVARDNAILFLATGVAGMQGRMANVGIIVQSLQPMILGALTTHALQQDAAAMFAAGDQLRGAAATLFAADRAVKLEVRQVVAPSAAALSGQLGALLEDFSAAAARSQMAVNLDREAMRRNQLALAAGILLVLLAAAVVTSRGVARPIAALTRAVQRMAQGDTRSAIGHTGRSDEVGRMAAALEVLRQAVQTAHMQAQMLEQLPVGVMTCTADGEAAVTYLNAETKRLLAPVQAHLSTPIESLIGTGLARLHRELEDRREALTDPSRLPYRARVQLGGETFELRVSALRHDDGRFAGPMLNWTPLTGQVQLSDRFERSVGGIAQAVGRAAAEMQATAQAMNERAMDGGRRLIEVSDASQAATGNVQNVAANAEQLATSVTEIGRMVAQSAAIAGGAVAEAEATDRSVSGLAEAASRIGDVVRLIGDIAGRTNLLALNATIEAARAGEAGRGFAVVAAEVKNLANQTARATGEIGTQITAMQGATGQAVAALRSIGGTITRMNEIATAIAGAVEQQGAATQEIARSVQQAAGGTARVDGNIAQLTQTVRETGDQAREVVAAAQALREQSTVLDREATEFLAQMRAA